MGSRTTLAVAAAAAATVVGVAVPAQADPPAPRVDGDCAGALDGALTALSDSGALLQCRDGSWQVYTDVYPSSDRWLSYGPELTVHGQGRRNPEFRAGAWTGSPQDDSARCTATMRDVVAAGELGEPQVLTTEPGQLLQFTASPRLFSAILSGFCLWQREA